MENRAHTKSAPSANSVVAHQADMNHQEDGSTQRQDDVQSSWYLAHHLVTWLSSCVKDLDTLLKTGHLEIGSQFHISIF